MKREALFHPKMLDLAARLNISQAQAIGHITMLINWTADFAIQGDIGKWPNGAIARGAGWDASPDTFVDALTDAGWLDPHETHRLLLHDWPDHAERWVKSKLSSLGLPFCAAYGGTKGNASSDTSRDTSAATSEDPPRDQTKPNQTKPNQTKPNQCRSETSFDVWWEHWPKKTAKQAAAKAYQKAIRIIKSGDLEHQPAESPDVALLAFTSRYAAAVAKWPDDDKRFIPNPATWLNEGRYWDDPTTWERREKSNGRKVDNSGQTFTGPSAGPEADGF